MEELLGSLVGKLAGVSDSQWKIAIGIIVVLVVISFVFKLAKAGVALLLTAGIVFGCWSGVKYVTDIDGVQFTQESITKDGVGINYKDIKNVDVEGTSTLIISSGTDEIRLNIDSEKMELVKSSIEKLIEK